MSEDAAESANGETGWAVSCTPLLYCIQPLRGKFVPTGQFRWAWGPVKVWAHGASAPIADAYGYSSHDQAAFLAGTWPDATTLTVDGVLAHDVSTSKDGRVEGALITFPASFPDPMSVLFATSNRGLETGPLLRSGGPPPALTPLRVTMTSPKSGGRASVRWASGSLYPAQIKNSSFSVTKASFEHIDFTFPSARDDSTTIDWRGAAANTPFTWQTSDDNRITAAARKYGQYGLLAGITLGVAGSIFVAILERLLRQ